MRWPESLAIYSDAGSLEIAHALRRIRPHYHFFGHYGGPVRSLKEANGVTEGYKLADLAWESGHDDEQVLAGGLMGLLWWHHRSAHAFEILQKP